MSKSSKFFKLTALATLAVSAGAMAADANQQYANQAKREIVNLNANYNGFQSNKDYENFIQSRSKLLKRNKENTLREVDVLAQPANENVVRINAFHIVPEDGVYKPLVAELEAIAKQYDGNEFNARRIAALKNNLTNHIIRSGYATSGLYGTNESFSKDNGEFTFFLKWGKVGNVRVADDEHPEAFKNRAMLWTLPHFSDDILTITGIDQTIENLTTPNKQVSVDVAATLNKTGYSDIIIHPYRTLAPHVTATFNNANSKGQVGAVLSATAGDLIGINDSWTASYNTRLTKEFGNRYLHVLSLRYDQPIDWFNLSINNTLTKFKNTTVSERTETAYTVHAPSFSQDYKLSYNLFRDQFSITNIYGGFNWSTGYQDVRLTKPQPAVLTFAETGAASIKFGANYLNNALFGGRFYADAYYTQTVAGAKTADYDETNQLTGYGKTLNFYLNYNRNFQALDYTWNSTTTASGQMSLSSSLGGSMQTTYGDAYSVRGLREETFSGDNGALITSTVGPIFPIDSSYLSQVNPFAGVDFAFASSPQDKNREAESYYGSSIALGVNLRAQNWNSSLTAGFPLAVKLPKSSQGEAKPYPVQLYWNLSFSF